MAFDSIFGWSQTAASNGAADTTINFADFQMPSSVNDSCRALMARIAEWMSDLAPNRTSTSSANAYTVASDASGPTLVNGQQITFLPDATNTSACTLNVGSTGLKAWRPASGVEFTAGNVLVGVPVTAYYREASDEWLSPGTGYYVTSAAEGVALQSITARLPQIGDLVVSFSPTPGPGRIRLTEATQSVLKTAYPELNNYLSGISYPWGSTATHFSLPPAAGYFLRFAGTTSSIDTSGARTAGSTQSDQNKAHTHTISGTGSTSSDGAHTHNITNVPNSGSDGTTGGGSISQNTTTYTTTSNGAHTHTVTVSGTAASSGSDEVRVKNVAFHVDVVASTALAAAQLAVFGFPFQWDTGTTDATPGVGRIRIDNATLASATYIYVSNTDGWGVTLTGIYTAFTQNTIVNISKVGAQSNRLAVYVTGTPIAGSGYYKIPCIVLSSAGTFASNDQCAFEFSLSSADGNVAAATAQAALAASSAAAAAASAASITLNWITANTTLNVPGTYATIAAAMTYLSTRLLSPNVTVTIQVADGTHAMGSGLSFSHPHGSQIQIIGNTTTPANCVLRADLTAVACIYIMPSQTLGMINGFEIQCSTTIAGRAVGGAGILCDSGMVTVGTSMIVRRFYFGIMARFGGVIYASGTSVSNRVQVFTSGDAAYIAIYGGVIYAAYAYASGTTAVPDGDDRWGIGFVGEANGVIYAQYSVSTANMWAGYGAFTSGVIWGGYLTATNATGGTTRNGDGLVAYYGGTVDGGNSTITGNAGFAIYETDGGIISEYGTMTMSTNADGERQNKLLFSRSAPGVDPELQASGADTNIGVVVRSKGTGAVYLNSNSATAFAALSDASAVNHMYARAAATGGPPILHTNGSDTNIDLCFQPKGTGVLRFGTYTATPGTITGYMTIKDFAGNTRKIAVTT